MHIVFMCSLFNITCYPVFAYEPVRQTANLQKKKKKEEEEHTSNRVHLMFPVGVRDPEMKTVPALIVSDMPKDYFYCAL